MPLPPNEQTYRHEAVEHETSVWVGDHGCGYVQTRAIVDVDWEVHYCGEKITGIRVVKLEAQHIPTGKWIDVPADHWLIAQCAAEIRSLIESGEYELDYGKLVWDWDPEFGERAHG